MELIEKSWCRVKAGDQHSAMLPLFSSENGESMHTLERCGKKVPL